MRWLQACVLGVMGVASASAHADSWAPPCPEAFLSPNKRWRLVVVPSGADNFKHCPLEQRRLGVEHTRSWIRARGTLQRWSEDRWLPVWQASLVNERLARAVVADEGQVATTDQSGRGSAEVVLYDRQGHPVRSLALTDFLPKFYVHVLPHSVSAIHWGSARGFSSDGQRLMLRVRVPPLNDEAAALDPPEYVELVLDARTGAALPPQGPAWERALEIATRADAVRCAAEKQELDRYLAQLSPQARDEEAKRYGTDGRDALGACGPLVDLSADR